MRLKQAYGDELRFFTKSQLPFYDQLPEPYPEAIALIHRDNRQKMYCLEVIQEHQPPWLVNRLYAKYMRYLDEAPRFEAGFLPKVILLTDTPRQQRLLARRVDAAMAKEGAVVSLQCLCVEELP